ncbi:MAG: alpha/beta fold hydrolase [Phycisphaeraceae bacterium]|nr:alpha/beta fold hydrolase [Phycisphaeraceae bacterium]
MPDFSSMLPSALAAKTQFVTLAGVPALVAHPDWEKPAPAVIWMHGRTVHKELDPGRYLRWVRAGIAAVALDLPGHGARAHPPLHGPEHTLDVVERMLSELDKVIEAIGQVTLRGRFDPQRLAIGGMSAGGMVALRRLCDPHPFACAAVEATCGDFAALYAAPRSGGSAPASHPPERVASLDPSRRLETWRPIPILALHSEADQWVPFQAQRAFIDRLQNHYAAIGADPSLVRLHAWPETGAPFEHAGFGRFGPEAKDIQTAFFVRHLRPEEPQ